MERSEDHMFLSLFSM